MEEKKIILFPFGENVELKKSIINILKKNNPIEIISTEYIKNPIYDQGLTDFTEITDSYKRQVRLNNSIFRKLSTNEKDGQKSHFIVDVDGITEELIGVYSRNGKDTGHELIKININPIAQAVNNPTKILVFLQSLLFVEFAKLFKNSDISATIIGRQVVEGVILTQNQRYVSIAAAFSTSNLIIVDDSLMEGDEKAHYIAFGSAHDFTSTFMETEEMDVTKPTLTMNGKPLVINRTKPDQLTDESTGSKEAEKSAEDIKTSSIKSGNEKIKKPGFWKRFIMLFKSESEDEVEKTSEKTSPPPDPELLRKFQENLKQSKLEHEEHGKVLQDKAVKDNLMLEAKGLDVPADN